MHESIRNVSRHVVHIEMCCIIDGSIPPRQAHPGGARRRTQMAQGAALILLLLRECFGGKTDRWNYCNVDNPWGMKLKWLVVHTPQKCITSFVMCLAGPPFWGVCNKAPCMPCDKSAFSSYMPHMYWQLCMLNNARPSKDAVTLCLSGALLLFFCSVFSLGEWMCCFNI